MMEEVFKKVEELEKYNRESTAYKVTSAMFSVITGQLIALLLYKSIVAESGAYGIDYGLYWVILPQVVGFFVLLTNLVDYQWRILVLISEGGVGQLFTILISFSYPLCVFIGIQKPVAWVFLVSIMLLLISLKNIQIATGLGKNHPLRHLFFKWGLFSFLYALASFLFSLYTQLVIEATQTKLLIADIVMCVVIIGFCAKNAGLFPKKRIVKFRNAIDKYLSDPENYDPGSEDL